MTLTPRENDAFPIPHPPTSELVFDEAIMRHDIFVAQRSIRVLGDHMQEQFKRQVYPTRMANILLKEISMPLYVRDIYEARGETPPDLETDVSAIYGQSAELIRILRRRLASNKRAGRSENYMASSDIIGGLSEATIFALTTREIRGDEEDDVTILPSHIHQDWGMGASTKYAHIGFDFLIKKRRSHQQIHAQVKTLAKAAKAKAYSGGVVMISAEAIAGGRRRIIDLQDAIIAETMATATPEQRVHIQESSERLQRKYDRHLGNIGLRSVDIESAS